MMQLQTSQIVLWRWTKKKSKTGEDSSHCTAHVLALIIGVVDMCVVLYLKHILKSWQLCLSFKMVF